MNDLEKLGEQLSKSGKSDKLKSLADSADGKAVSRMVDSEAVQKAAKSGDMAALREELGDVLMQVIFHAQIEEDAGRFTLDDVADTVCKKLIYRHPHVFGTVRADDS